MPYVRPVRELARASEAILAARNVRKRHARRTERGSHNRELEIKRALESLHASMMPLRTIIGRFPYGPQTEEAEKNRQEIKDISQAIQRERRKLWKMKVKRKKIGIRKSSK